MIYKNFKEYFLFNISNIDKISFFSQNCRDAVLGSTYLGLFWIVMRPILTLASITFLFIFVLKVDYNEIPFLLFISGSLMVWNLFDEMLFWSTRALTSNKAYIKNFKSPNLIIIISGNFLGLIILSVYVFYFLCILSYYLIKNYTIFDFNLLGLMISIMLVFIFSFSGSRCLFLCSKRHALRPTTALCPLLQKWFPKRLCSYHFALPLHSKYCLQKT